MLLKGTQKASARRSGAHRGSPSRCFCKGIGEGQKPRTSKRSQKQGSEKAAAQESGVCSTGRFCSGEPGDGCLDAGGGRGAQDTVHRKNHLINAHLFCTDGPGEEYSIEEPHDAGEHPGGSEEKSAPDDRVGAGEKRGLHILSELLKNGTFFIYMKENTLTEPTTDDILLQEIRVKQSELTEGMTK